MKTKWKLTVRAGVVVGLVLAGIVSPVFLMSPLPASPVILIGLAVLYPLAGFVAGRNAVPHPIWASVISALTASLGILVLGVATMKTSSDASAPSDGLARMCMMVVMARMMFLMWFQQTCVLTALSVPGGVLALFMNRRKPKPSNSEKRSVSRGQE